MNFFQRYFGIEHTQSKGFLLLLFLLLALLAVPQLLKWSIESPDLLAENDQKNLHSLIAQLEEEAQTDSLERQNTYFQKKQVQFFAFDPNTATQTELEKLGLHASLAQRIVTYRQKGGKFRTKQDLQKIYGFSEQRYAQLEKFIVIDTQNELFAQKTAEKTPFNDYKNIPAAHRSKLTSFDINQADTAQLIQIKGIGSVLATRIVKFRDNLGGFYSLEQLKEVYGISEEAQTQLLNYAILESSFKKININESDLKHPYIKAFQAKAILNYRQQHGKFEKIEDLLQIKSLDAAWFEKVKPYLTL